MKLFKKLVSGVLALSIAAGAFGSMSAVTAQDAPDEVLDDAEFERIRELSKNDVINLDPLKDVMGVINADQTFPEKFDLRDVNGVNYVTPVRSQGGLGTCWAFGALAASEISVIYELMNSAKKDVDIQNFGFSPLQLAWFGLNHLPTSGDVPNRQYGEGVYAKDKVNSGGFTYYGTNTLANGIGPVTEELVPYRNKSGKILCTNEKDSTDRKTVYSLDEVPEGYIPRYYYYDASENDDWAVDDELRFYSCIRFNESYMLPGLYDKSGDKPVFQPTTVIAVKEQLMAGRGVSVAFYADSSRASQTDEAHYISENWAHFTYDPTLNSNHRVCIVGWDDTYSKDNFLQGSSEEGYDRTPPGDGAWIVKNSWGRIDGEFPSKNKWGVDGSGYFYLSYYDYSANGLEAFDYDVETYGENHSNDILQYDYAPILADANIQNPSAMSYANVYKATKNYFIESIGMISLTPGTEISYKIFKLDPVWKTPSDGVLVAEGSGSFKYGGYHTLDLDEKIELNTNESIGVVITEKVDDMYYIPRNYGVSEIGRPEFYTKTTINRNESFVCWEDESWCDWKDYLAYWYKIDPDLQDFTFDNHMIKVITSENPNAPVVPVEPEYAGTELTVGTDGKYATINDAVAAINADIKAKKADEQYVINLLSDINETKAVTFPAVSVVLTANLPATVTMKSPSVTAKGSLVISNVNLKAAADKKTVTITAKDVFMALDSSFGALKTSKMLAYLQACDVNGKITAAGPLLLGGDSTTINGAVSCSSKTGALQIISAVAINGSVTTSGPMFIGDDAMINGNLSVGGELIVSGDASVSGKLTLKSKANINGIIIKAE